MQFIIVLFTMIIFIIAISMIIHGAVKGNDITKNIGYCLLCVSVVGYLQIMFIRMEEASALGSQNSSLYGDGN